MNRRSMLKASGNAAAITILGGIPLNTAAETPDVVITHWPIDGHRDHANCGILVLAAWKQLKRCFDLYYFEVMSGWQTQMFHPTDFVDITTTRERKYQACYCHESQHLTKVMESWHTPMEQFRGIECRCTAAEAFAHHIEPLKMDRLFLGLLFVVFLP